MKLRETTIRASLWFAVLLNLGAAVAFAFPSSPPSRWVRLPHDVPVVYAALCGYLIALFAGLYAWLAARKPMYAPALWFGALGKGGAALLGGILWSRGHVPAGAAAIGLVDLGLAAIWVAWLATADR